MALVDWQSIKGLTVTIALSRSWTFCLHNIFVKHILNIHQHRHEFLHIFLNGSLLRFNLFLETKDEFLGKNFLEVLPSTSPCMNFALFWTFIIWQFLSTTTESHPAKVTDDHSQFIRFRNIGSSKIVQQVPQKVFQLLGSMNSIKWLWLKDLV